MDQRTARCSHGAPEMVLSSSIINSQMAEYYGLPTFGFAGTNDSKVPDAQAASEATMHILMSGLSGVNLIHDCGYLAGSSGGSMEMAVICDEIIGMACRIIQGLDVREDTLAVDLINEVGPGGNFLGKRHTIEHFKREIFLPALFDKRSELGWLRTGGKDLREIARDRALLILRDHHPEPLPADILRDLSKIIKDAKQQVHEVQPT